METKNRTKEEIQNQIWEICNSLRGQMDSSDFKNYILGVIFFKYLSDQFEEYLKNEVDGEDIFKVWYDEKYGEELINEALNDKGYYIEPKHLFSTIIKEINEGNSDFINNIQHGMNDVSRYADKHKDSDDFVGLFADFDLSNNKLGVTQTEKNNLISEIFLKIDDIFYDINNSDLLGDVYEFLLKQFASDAGKKGGEFYTPHEVSQLIASLTTLENKKAKTIYDPTCGSGSLLIKAANGVKEAEKICGQEKNVTTYNLARMNMLLHGFHFRQFNIQVGDTLDNDKFNNEKFDIIVANPPFGTKWNHENKEDDPRFKGPGKLPPKGQGEFAFIEHMIYHLANDGIMATVAPLGVLSRGKGEKIIREYLIEKLDCVDAVIGLPSNLFFNTPIPACILVFKKSRKNKDILFIDASREFEKVKAQNKLTKENIDKILNTYKNRKEINKYSRNISIDEIKENDFNLNIPRYIDTFEEEEPIDIEEVNKQLKELKESIKKKEAKLEQLIKELVEVDNVK